MAGYAYINIRVSGPSQQRRVETFGAALKLCVERTLDDRWKIELIEGEGDPRWWVHLPGTAVPENGMACTDDGRAFDEDIGFPVTLTTSRIEFRHVPGQFPYWAQRRVEEQLSEYYGHGIYFDASGRTSKPGPKDYRVGKTFYDYLARNFQKPLSPEDRAFVDRYKVGVPKGHWGEPGNV